MAVYTKNGRHQHGDPYEEILSRLEPGKYQANGEYRTKCPAHEDNKPSLNVRREGDRVLLKCFADCTAQEITEAVGLTMSDLFYDEPESSTEEEIAYPYVDEDGVLLYEAVRQPGKKFLQRAANGKYSVKGIRRVLYRLPDLIRADPGALVFVVEGEKDADNLRKRGLIATTKAAGASSPWISAYNDALLDKRIVVIPDFDDAGHECCTRVVKSLADAGAQVVPLALPDLKKGGDVTNWLESGGTAEALVALAEKELARIKPKRQRAISFTADELVKMEFAEPKWAVPGIIAQGLTILAGPPKIRKSWMLYQTAIAIASGGYALGMIKVPEGDVLYLALEDTERRLKDRLIKLLNGQPAPPRLHIRIQIPKIGAGFYEEISEWLREHPEARLVVVDTLAVVKPSTKSKGNIYEDDYSLGRALKTLADDHDIAVVCITHTRKSEAEDWQDMINSSQGLPGAADTNIVLMRENGGIALKGRGRDVEEFDYVMEFDNAHCLWNIKGDGEEVRMSQDRRDILDFVTESRNPVQPGTIAREIGKNASTVRTLLAKMVEDGQIAHVQGKGYGPTFEQRVRQKQQKHDPFR